MEETPEIPHDKYPIYSGFELPEDYIDIKLQMHAVPIPLDSRGKYENPDELNHPQEEIIRKISFLNEAEKLDEKTDNNLLHEYSDMAKFYLGNNKWAQVLRNDDNQHIHCIKHRNDFSNEDLIETAGSGIGFFNQWPLEYEFANRFNYKIFFTDPEEFLAFRGKPTGNQTGEIWKGSFHTRIYKGDV